MSNNLNEFRILLKILADLVDESIISEWHAGLITGAYSMKNSIACFDFGLYSSDDVFNIQNPRPVGDETDNIYSDIRYKKS